MIADDTQEELSMEEILSSIKDILDEDMQESHADTREPQMSAPVVAEASEASAVVVEDSAPQIEINAEETTLDTPSVSEDFEIPDFSSLTTEEKEDEVLELPVIEEAEEDIFDLSSAMIIQNEPETVAQEEVITQETEPQPELEPQIPEPVAEVQEETPVIETMPEEEPELSVSAFDDLGLPDVSEFQEAVSAEIPEEDAPEIEPIAENNAAEERSLLSDILKTEENNEETPEEPLNIAADDVLAEYTVDDIDVDSEPFYPDVPVEEPMPLPVVEPEESQIVNNDILSSYQIQETEEIQIETPVEPQSMGPDGDDVNDVSASIINSFAKIFSHADEVAPEQHQKIDYSKVETLGNASLTIEDIVESVVYDVVSSRVDTALQNNMIIEDFAKNEIARQTQIWLTTQMPSLIETLVKKEIERVMAKVGR